MLAGITLALRHYVVQTLTSDGDTEALAADVMRVVAAFHVRPLHARSRQVADSFQGTSSGVLRGCGLQSVRGAWRG